jgi:two-component system, OmpR family, response regulator
MLRAPMAHAIQPHVLVVEDHHNSRDMLCEVLEQCGFRTSAAMSADAAKAIVDTGGIAAIVTDIALVGSQRDGVWLLHQVAPLRIPVIAVTGHAERLDEFARLGFVSVLVKPFDRRTGTERLRSRP